MRRKQWKNQSKVSDKLETYENEVEYQCIECGEVYTEGHSCPECGSELACIYDDTNDLEELVF